MYTTTRYIIGSLLTLMGFCSAASGQQWPSHPVKIVVPYAAGGTVDILARYLGEQLGSILDAPMVIENRAGAGGNIGMRSVVRATPDGYTLLIAGNPTHAMNPHLYKDLGFNPIEDMTSIALIGAAPNLLVVNPALPVNSVEDLVRLAREKPNSVAFASSGIGLSGHLAGELFAREAGIHIRHIPYKGQADAILGVVRGDVAFAFVTIPGTLAQVEAGKLRALATTSSKRSPLVPDVPTIAESGYPNFEVMAWYNLSGPLGLSADVTSRLKTALSRIMDDENTKLRFASLGLEPWLMVGGQYDSFLKKEYNKWGDIIRLAGIGGK